MAAATSMLSLSVLMLAVLVLGTPCLVREFKMMWLWKAVPAIVTRTNIIPKRLGCTLEVEYELQTAKGSEFETNFGPEWGKWYPTRQAAERVAKVICSASTVAYIDSKSKKAYFSARKYDVIDKFFAPIFILTLPMIGVTALFFLTAGIVGIRG